MAEALASVFDQGVADLQVIVVDDGSTDQTASMVARYGDRVQYVYQRNRGPAAARNLGVSLAKGVFVSFLDSDDVWLPGKMEAEMAIFQEIQQADAVISDCESWREGRLVAGSWFESQGLILASGVPRFVPLYPPLYFKKKLFATCCLTIRRTVLERLGPNPFDVSLKSHEDWDLAIRLHQQCNIVALPQSFAKVRRFNDGTRAGRPLPALDCPPEIKCIKDYRRYRILDKARRSKGWPGDVDRELKSAMSEAARSAAANFRGWRRGSLLPLAWMEMRRGEFLNCVKVLALGVLPFRAVFNKESQSNPKTDSGERQGI